MFPRLLYVIIIGVLVFTIDGLGQNTWVKTFWGSGDDKSTSIIQTNDGGFIIAGFTSSDDGTFKDMNIDSLDFFVIKTDSLGSLIWKKIYGGTGTDGSKFSDAVVLIAKTHDNAFIVTGESSSNDGDFADMNKGRSDILVFKIDSIGNIIWKKSIGGSHDDVVASMVIDSSNNIILTGYTNSVNGDFVSTVFSSRQDLYIIKLNDNGEIVWTFVNDGGKGTDITVSKDGHYVICGWKIGSSNFGIDYDIVAIKISNAGDIIWSKSYGTNYIERGYSISTLNNGSYVIAGWYGSLDMLVTIINDNGDFVRNILYSGSGWDEANAITSTKDGGFILTGEFHSKDGDFSNLDLKSGSVILIKHDSWGAKEWMRSYNIGKGSEGESLIQTTDNGFAVTGIIAEEVSGDKNGSIGVFLMKLDSNGNLNTNTSINEFSELTTTLSIHPNPFSNSTTISYKVYTPTNVRIELLNNLGQTIEVLLEDYTEIGSYQIPLYVSTLSSGMYSVRMRSGSMNEVVPVWVVR